RFSGDGRGEDEARGGWTLYPGCTWAVPGSIEVVLEEDVDRDRPELAGRAREGLRLLRRGERGLAEDGVGARDDARPREVTAGVNGQANDHLALDAVPLRVARVGEMPEDVRLHGVMEIGQRQGTAFGVGEAGRLRRGQRRRRDLRRRQRQRRADGVGIAA